jgi:hypothetical protein
VTLHTASYRNWRQDLGAPVVTSLQVPRWLPEAEHWPRLWAASPRWAYFRAPAAEFDKAYLAQLDRHGAKQIAGLLAAIARHSGAGRLVLLCFRGRPRRLPPVPVRRLVARRHRRAGHRNHLTDAGQAGT